MQYLVIYTLMDLIISYLLQEKCGVIVDSYICLCLIYMEKNLRLQVHH